MAGRSFNSRSISENSQRNRVEGTETKNLCCNSMDRCQTLLDTSCTIEEYGGRRYGTHRFGTGKGTRTAVSRRDTWIPWFYNHPCGKAWYWSRQLLHPGECGIEVILLTIFFTFQFITYADGDLFTSPYLFISLYYIRPVRNVLFTIFSASLFWWRVEPYFVSWHQVVCRFN